MMNRTLFCLRNFQDKALKILADPYLFVFYVNTYLISRYKQKWITTYVVSYPKSGRTWARTTTRRYLELAQNLGRFDRDGNHVRRPDGSFIKFDEDQGAWVPMPRRIDQLRFNERKYRGTKVCFIARHPGDVVVSSWYHLTYRERIYRGTLSEFIREPLVGVEKVIAFLNMWMANSDVPAAFQLVTYEEMRRDPLTAFAAMFRFIGFEPDPDLLARAVADTSFEQMKKMELEKKVAEPWLRIGAEKSERGMKVRKGKIGGYREELSPEDVEFIHEKIAAKLHPALPYGRELAAAGTGG